MSETQAIYSKIGATANRRKLQRGWQNMWLGMLIGVCLCLAAKRNIELQMHSRRNQVHWRRCRLKLRGVGPVVHAGARVEPGHLVAVFVVVEVAGHCGIVGPHFVPLVGLTHHATPWEFWVIDPRDAVRGPRGSIDVGGSTSTLALSLLSAKLPK